MNPSTDRQDELLARTRTLIAERQVEEAVGLARQRDTVDVHDAAYHLQWADCLEDLDLFEEAILELHLALRDDPCRAETCRRLAEAYLDQGRPEKAARCWRSLIKRGGGDAASYKELGRVLEEAGDYEKALEAYREGRRKTSDPEFETLIKTLSFVDTQEEETPLQAGDQIVPARHNLVTFTSLFAGREGVYARQWASPTGETGYTPIHEPLTLAVAEQHILGAITIGVYPVRLDNTVTFLAFDLDLPKFLVAKAIRSESLWKKAMDRVHATACRLMDAAAAFDLPLYLEDSGFKGRHGWIFLESPIPAGVAKKCGELLLARSGRLDEGVQVEVFPKQGRVGKGGLGNLIKLPLGYHKRTGLRALFLEPEGRPYPDQLGLLESVVKAPRRAVYALIQRIHAQGGVVKTTDHPKDTPWRVDAEDEAARRQPIQIEEPYDLDEDEQFQLLLERCPVIRRIVEKIHLEATVDTEETLVLIHTVGHLEQGARAVNALFERCTNADPSLFMKSRLRGNPVSCPKIRSRIPHITSKVACNCTFDTDLNLYPTPLLHVHDAGRKRPLGPGDSVVPQAEQFEKLVDEYVKLRVKAKEIASQLSRCEGMMNAYFEQAGVEAMETRMGIVRRLAGEGGRSAFALEMDATRRGGDT